jgi:hypothetical protein
MLFGIFFKASEREKCSRNQTITMKDKKLHVFHVEKVNVQHACSKLHRSGLFFFLNYNETYCFTKGLKRHHFF